LADKRARSLGKGTHFHFGSGQRIFGRFVLQYFGMIDQYSTVDFDLADLKGNIQQLQFVTWTCLFAHEDKKSKIPEKLKMYIHTIDQVFV
jgi:hypothetical protein